MPGPPFGYNAAMTEDNSNADEATPAAGMPAAEGLAEDQQAAGGEQGAGDGRLVLVTGATGLVGWAVIEKLLDSGSRVRALVTPGGSARHFPGAETISGDLRAPETLGAAMDGVDVVVSAARIAREDRAAGRTYSAVYAEGTRNLVGAAKSAGVERIVHVSSLGAAGNAPSAELRMMAIADEAVAASGVEHVILRPSILFGEGTLLERMLLRWASGSMPVTLVPGQADFPLQPVSVGDVAEAAARAAEGRIAAGNYELAGPKRMILLDLIEVVMDAAGRCPLRLHVPGLLLVVLGPVLEHLPTGGGALPRPAELAHLKAGWLSGSSRAEDLLGRSAEKIEDWVKACFSSGLASAASPAG